MDTQEIKARAEKANKDNLAVTTPGWSDEKRELKNDLGWVIAECYPEDAELFANARKDILDLCKDNDSADAHLESACESLSNALDRVAELRDALQNLLIHVELIEVTEGFEVEVLKDDDSEYGSPDIYGAIKQAKKALYGIEEGDK